MSAPKSLQSDPRRIWLLPFALLWLGVSLFATFKNGNGSSSFCFLPFIAIGVGLLIWCLIPLIVGIKVGAPEVSLSKDALCIGESCVFTYQQVFRQAVDVENIAMQLIFCETATYRRGTDTQTVTHETIIDQFEQPGQHFEAGQSLSFQHTWRIPDQAMHTFNARHNKLYWLLKIQVKLADWPDFTGNYPIHVLPQLVQSEEGQHGAN